MKSPAPTTPYTPAQRLEYAAAIAAYAQSINIPSLVPVSKSSIINHQSSISSSPPAPPDWAQFLVRYQEAILFINHDVNLTAIVEAGDFLLRHHFDSLATVLAVPELLADRPLRVLDVGTGAGFPGVPLWAALPRHRYTLIDGTAKKIHCVDEAFRTAMNECTAAGLFTTAPPMQLEFLPSRAELLVANQLKRNKSFDLVLARATGPGLEVLKNTEELIRSGGKLVLYYSETTARGEADLQKELERRKIPAHISAPFEIRHGDSTIKRRHHVITIP